MYSKILVPLDGSKRAEAILQHVEELAARCKAVVVFLQVIEPIPAMIGPEGTRIAQQQIEIERRTEQAEEYLKGVQGEFHRKGIEAKARVAYGAVVQAIIDLAQQEDVDLIALASHGRTGLPQVFYGSVAAGVLHRVDRPLLLVRSREE